MAKYNCYLPNDESKRKDAQPPLLVRLIGIVPAIYIFIVGMSNLLRREPYWYLSAVLVLSGAGAILAPYLRGRMRIEVGESIVYWGFFGVRHECPREDLAYVVIRRCDRRVITPISPHIFAESMMMYLYKRGSVAHFAKLQYDPNAEKELAAIAPIKMHTNLSLDGYCQKDLRYYISPFH